MQPAVIKSSSRALLAAIAASVLLLIALPFSGAQSTGAFNVNFNTGSIPSQFVVDTGSAPASSGSNSGSFSAANCELNQGMLALKVTQSGASPVISTGCEVRTSAAYGYGTYSVTMRASSTATTPNGAGSASDGQISTAFTFINNSLTEIDMPEIEGTGGCGGAGSCSDTLEWTNYINGPGNKQFTQTTLANPQDAFHVYKMVWQPNRIDFYVDGALATTHTQNIPTAPAYFLVSSYGTNSTSFGGDANVGVTRRMYVSNMSFVPAGTPVPPTIGTYYVSSAGGNDANSGTSPTSCGTNCGPWKTINHAITAFQLSPTGATIHVLTGTYNEATQNGCVQGEQPTICISRGGTSTLAPLVLKCDATNWTVPSSPSTGCKINFNFGSHVGISLGAANFVQIVGPFEFSGPTTDVAIIAGCDGKNPTVHTGLCPNGNGLVVDGIYAHDMGQTDGCPSTGVVSAGPSHGSNAFYNPAPIVRNSRFQHIGDLALARKNGGSCNQYHAVYLSAPNAVIENNLFLDVVSFSIHAYSYPCGTVVRNNTIVRDGASGMTLSGGDCPIAGRQPGLQTVTNNISIDAGQSGITFTAGSDSSCTSSTPNLASNNMFGGNPDGDYSLGSNPTCTTVANSLHSTGPALFVHYLGSLSQTNGNDDLHLKPGSPAIGAGTTACVPGGQSCPDANDRDGNAMSNPPPIGAYTAAVSLPTVSNYYVSPNGSDSNDGSASSPWLTLTHADSALTLGLAGTTVHVLPGIYSGLELVLSHSGTSTQRIVWQSDTPWSAQIIQSQANGTDCCVVVVNGSYVDMVGFDVSSTLVNTSSATTLGRIGLLANTGVSIHFLGNRIHDVANGTGGLNCSAFGGQGVGSNTGSTGTWVRGNWIFRVGAPGTCNKIHGIYDGSPNEIIDDNVIFQNAAWGINCVHACSDSVITNNTVFSNGGYGLTDVGTFSMGGCVLQGSDSTSQTNTIKNNICYNNGAGASGGSGASILNISGTVNDVLVVSNLIYNPQSGNGVGGGQGCTDDASCVDSGTGTGWSIGGNVYGTVPGFVNYQPDGSGDYDLAPGSAAAGAGATICLGSPVSCTPTNDVAGTEMSNPPPIGAYTAPILTSSITITPSSYDFGIVPVGGANTVLTTVTNAETTSTHWGACGDTACSGGASDATTFNQSFGSPSILSMTGPAYSNALFYYKIPGTSAATTFATDFYVTPDANGPTAQTFEFDTFQFLGGVEYMWGSQCNQARGVWQIWDQLNTQWVDISPTIPCAITAP